MISDTLKNAGKYASLNSLFKKAFDFLQKEDLHALKPGRHDIDGDELFILKQCYETQPPSEKKLEAHKNYIDIQYIIKGSEIMAYTAGEDLPVQTAYKADSDILFFKESRGHPSFSGRRLFRRIFSRRSP